MKKLYFIAGILLVLLIVYACFATYRFIQKGNDYDRMSNNYLVLNKQLDSIKTRNNEYAYCIDGLKLTVKEFTLSNTGLEDEIKNLKLKVKNLQSITKIEYRYIVSKDSNDIEIEPINDSCFKAYYTDDWVNFSQNICMEFNRTSITIDSLQFALTDSLLMPYDVKYKGWWFWKKPIGVKVYIKSYNPYFKIDKIQSITFTK